MRRNSKLTGMKAKTEGRDAISEVYYKNFSEARIVSDSGINILDL